MFSILNNCLLLTKIILYLSFQSFQVLIDEFIENSIHEIKELISIYLFLFQKKKKTIIKRYP